MVDTENGQVLYRGGTDAVQYRRFVVRGSCHDL